MKDKLQLLFKGSLLGVVEVVPGFSAGSLALILGIYHKILHSISSLFLIFQLKHFIHNTTHRKEFFQALRFLLVIGIGSVLGVLITAKLMSWLFTHYQQLTKLFFVGVSIMIVYALLTNYHKANVRISSLVAIVLGIVFGLGLSFVNLSIQEGVLVLFIAGIIAASFMILPGISGSFMLLSVGLYEPVIQKISSFDLLGVLPLIIGVIVGVALISRLLSKLMNSDNSDQIYAFFAGVILGSINNLFTPLQDSWFANIVFIFLGMVFGFGLLRFSKN